MESTLGQADWRKSSYSGGTGNCVEVTGNLPGIVAVRDSQDPGGPALILTPAAWQAMTRKVRNGGLDLAAIPVRPSKNPREKANPGTARRLRWDRYQDAQQGARARPRASCG